MSLLNVDMVSVHTACDTLCFHFFTLSLAFQSIAFLLLFIWHWRMRFACACLCCQVHSLFLALFPLPQVLQGTTMQQLQQVQVAQSQATPITVNTSSPSKWPPIFPTKALLWNSKELFRDLFSWQLNKKCISLHNASAKISLFHKLYIKQCSKQKQRVW